MDKKEILERVKKDKVKFISFQFSDVTGKVKSVDAPVEQLEAALDNGIWFIACQMTMDLMGINMEELIDGVEVGGAATYMSTTDTATMN